MDWILSNKEWLFSGIGLALFTLLFVGMRRFFSINQQQSHNQLQSNQGKSAVNNKQPQNSPLTNHSFNVDQPKVIANREEMEFSPPCIINLKITVNERNFIKNILL